jgi:hypothetical protein
MAVRGFAAQMHKKWTDSYYSWWYSRTRYESWDEKQQDNEIEALLLWRPLRESLLDPYVGVGIRYGTTDCEVEEIDFDQWDLRGRYRGRGKEDWNDSGASLVGRLGLKVNQGLLFLTFEYIVASDVGDTEGTEELIFDVGFYLTQRMQMHLFAESLRMGFIERAREVGDEKGNGHSTIYGAGLSFDF